MTEARSQAELHKLELAARSSLEEHYGRALSDPEWASAKRALLELATLLRDWERERAHADEAA